MGGGRGSIDARPPPPPDLGPLRGPSPRGEGEKCAAPHPGHQARGAGRFRAGVRPVRRDPRAPSGARITLLTTAPFAGLRAASPWFDAVRGGCAAGLVGPARAAGGCAAALRGFDFVYDLQTSARSSRYFRLAGRPAWSGIARGASHPHANPARERDAHARAAARPAGDGRDRRRCRRPSCGWLTGRARPTLPPPYALLVPGAAPHRPAKRWPAERFGELAGAAASARGRARWWSAPQAERAAGGRDPRGLPGARWT